MGTKSVFYKVILFFFLICIPNYGHAQLLPGTEEKKETEEIPKDSLGRDNPRSAVNGFIKAMSDQNYIRASQYLKLKRSQQKPKERKRIVKNFQHLLDQGGNLFLSPLISDKPTGRDDDGQAQNVDIVGMVTIDKKSFNISVENYEGDSKPAVWLFSRETVEVVAAVKDNETLLVDRILPQILKDKMLAGVPLGHWIATIVFIAVAYILSWGIISLITAIIHLIWKKARTEPTKGIIHALSLPFRLYLAILFFVGISQQVGISIIIRQRFSSITVAASIIAILILLWRLTDYISTFSREKMSRRGRISAISVILFLRRTAKAALIVLGCIAILSAVGVDVTTWLAALGIGGIALALGAQKTVENFVGSVSLISDQPIRVGDFCKVGDMSGTVEQIGMRSTRFRTGERTVVTIPNGDLSASRIENFAHRDRFLFDPIFDLRIETTPDQIRFLLVELRTILYSHPQINPEPAKVRFTNVLTNAVRLEVYAYIEAPDFDTFQEIQEDVLLRMMDVITQSGTAFANNAQTVYITRDKGISAEKADEASARIKEWRDKEELQVPKFDPEKVKGLKETIQYPPEGSASAKKVREAKKENE